MGAWLEREPWLGERRREAAPRARAWRLFPRVPISEAGSERAGSRLHLKPAVYLSLGAEAVKPAAGCRVSSSSHLILKMRLIKSVLPLCVTPCEGMEAVPPAPHHSVHHIPPRSI